MSFVGFDGFERVPYSPCGSMITHVTPCFISSSIRTPVRYDFPPPVFARMLTCFCTIPFISTYT